MRPIIILLIVLVALASLPEPVSAGWYSGCNSACNGRARVGVARCCKSQGWGGGYCSGRRSFCITIINIGKKK
uniref:Uncharacterized protein n=1 Tax=Panagrolaimus superbus TaxID=310955 RepID=A0A914Y7R2_9BILA